MSPIRQRALAEQVPAALGIDVSIIHDGQLHDVRGFRASGVHAAIKRRRRDVCIIASNTPATCAGVFTQNRVVAAPVAWSKGVAAKGVAQAIVANSGSANACTGERGHADTKRMAELAGQALGVAPERVLVASTGVIGQLLPMEKIEAGIQAAATLLDANEAGAAAEAIMTTDTAPKQVVVEASYGPHRFRVGAVAKGSGMIAPNMATMLGFVVTDAAVDAATLQRSLSEVVDDTFNAVSVDHDTSTNDCVFVLANGQSGVRVGHEVPEEAFRAVLEGVCTQMAKAIARDGEGATKLLEVTVEGAATKADARRAAKAVVDSPLVKCAVHGADPNWGRILAALGYSGADFDPARVDAWVGGPRQRVQVLSNGEPLDFDHERAHRLMRSSDVHLVAALNAGDASAHAYGCDLTREYVDINAHYTT